MKNKGLFLILLIIFNIQYNFTFSQAFTFTSDSLISELKIYYELNAVDFSKNPDAYKKDSVINILGNLWVSKIKKGNRKIITDIFNYQNSKRFKKDKTIWHFINSIILFKKDDDENFAPWLSMLEYMTASAYIASVTVQKFITNLYNLQNENYLYLSTTSAWKLREGTYQFEYDTNKNKLFIHTSTGNIESYSTDDDTIKILNTKGSYDVIESIWKGENGMITWEKFGYLSSNINVRLNKYSINMKKTEFSADSVTYTNKVFGPGGTTCKIEGIDNILSIFCLLRG